MKDDVESRVSDTFQTLGELSIENENYEQAIEDLQTCLKRRQQMMPEDSRCIAETHYQIGVAQGFNLQFDEAMLSLDGAIQVLQLRIDLLKSKKEYYCSFFACTLDNNVSYMQLSSNNLPGAKFVNFSRVRLLL